MAKEKKVNFLVYKWKDGRPFFISPLHNRGGGNSYGYSTGRDLCAQAFYSAGWEFDTDAKIVFHYISPHFYVDIPRRVNILFTMWENEWLPNDLLEPFEQADYIIVPSENSKVAIRNALISTPVYVCHHAVDTEFYKWKLRDAAPEILQCLWVGSPNLRKGYDILTRAWYDLFHGKEDKVVLYMKSSRFRAEGEFKPMPQFKAILDTRNMSCEELRNLYWDSHIFLFPSRGEGAGLPPLEAMSTGLPVLAPPWSGMADYVFEPFAYPLKYSLVPVDYGCEAEMAHVDIVDFKRKILEVMNTLPKALERGKFANRMVNDEFSIARMGRRLNEILMDIQEKEGI